MSKVLKSMSVCFALFAMIVSVAQGQANAPRGERQGERQGERRQALTAPKVVPGSTAEMQSADFWISRIKDPDKIILTPAQIRELNKKNSTRGSEFTDAFGNPYSIQQVLDDKDLIGIMYHVEDPLSITSFPADSLRARIERSNNWFNNRNLYDRRNMKYDEDMKNELIDMTNVSSIPAKIITPRYGILVKHTLDRVMPTNLPASGGPGGWLDSFQSGMIDYGQPVAVLHVSKDHDWYYVRSEICFGWIPAVNVAFGSPKEIGDYINSTDFIVATCHKVPIYADKNFDVFIEDFYMGAKVRLTRKTADGYEVSYPYRKPDGSFGMAAGWVKPDARVSVGYQPFTQRNVINTLFTLLYRPYGWADSYNERDCCGMVRVVLRTCGIYTGRWTTHELHASDHVVMFPRSTPKEKKYEFLKGCEPGICFVGDGGHISTYLGEVDGKHYVIHQSGYSYNSEDGTRMNVNRVNVNDTELEGGSNIGSWTEITTIKP
ncbi:SH3 domain-containing protein [bacterium]|nr:SH3 domain-containing protein [bacterium]